MARGSPKCSNCRATLKEDSDHCDKCGLRIFFKCKKCGRKWSRDEGAFCPRCGGRPED